MSELDQVTDNQAVSWAIDRPTDNHLRQDPRHASQHDSDKACNIAGLAFANPSAAEAAVVRKGYVEEEVPVVDAFSLSTTRRLGC